MAVVAIADEPTGVPIVEGFSDLVLVDTGGFSRVYRAVQDHVGRHVAIKVLTSLDATDERARDRFLREVRSMGRLSGIPNIVDIIVPAFTSEGSPCIVMPFMAGGSVARRLVREGPLPTQDVVSLGAAIAGAVARAHDLGISHRDIKPENILLTEDGVPGLADFGIAMAEDHESSTETEASLSLAHAPPERLASQGSRAMEPAGDVYSLASTLSTLLAGHPPCGSARDLGIYEYTRRVIAGEVEPIARADVSDELRGLLSSALRTDASLRPTARELADALGAMAEGRSTAHAPPAGAGRTDPIEDPTVRRPLTRLDTGADASTFVPGRPPVAPARGSQASVVPPPPAPGSLPPTATRPPDRRGFLIAAIALLTVVVLGLAAIAVWLVRDDDPTATTVAGVTERPAEDEQASPVTEVSGASTAPPSPPPAPTSREAGPVTSPAPAPRQATVTRTCGASGTGDCFVALRAGPSSDAAELGRLDEGATVVVECQVPGASATSSVLGRSSTVWARDTEGRYLAAIFLDVPGWDPFVVTEPCP